MRRPAFTLIELLVVITIIGILVAIVVLNFGAVRAHQQLSLLADKSVAMLQTAQKEVRSGKYDSAAGAYLCEGAFFESGAEPLFVTMPYVDGACDPEATTATEENYGLITSPAVVNEMSILDGEDLTDDGLYALYLPVEGNLEFYNSSGTAYSGEVVVSFTTGNESGFTPISLHMVSLTGLVSISFDNEE